MGARFGDASRRGGVNHAIPHWVSGGSLTGIDALRPSECSYCRKTGGLNNQTFRPIALIGPGKIARADAVGRLNIEATSDAGIHNVAM